MPARPTGAARRGGGRDRMNVNERRCAFHLLDNYSYTVGYTYRSLF